MRAEGSKSRPAKKSETLEVRVSYPLKTAFADDCRRRGETVGDAIRDLMEARLESADSRLWPNRSRIETMTPMITRRSRAAAGSALAALSLGVAAPSAANDGLSCLVSWTPAMTVSSPVRCSSPAFWLKAKASPSEGLYLA